MRPRLGSHSAALVFCIAMAQGGWAFEPDAFADPSLLEEATEEDLLKSVTRQMELLLAALSAQSNRAQQHSIEATPLLATPPAAQRPATNVVPQAHALTAEAASLQREQAVAEIKAQAAADRQTNQKRYEKAKATATKRRDAQKAALSGYTPLNGYRRVAGGVAGEFAATQAALTKAYEATKAEIEATEKVKRAQLEVILPEEQATEAQLAWTIPETRVNGAPLPMGELVGYEIYYTQLDGSASGVITIADGTQSAHVVTGLQPGKYFFAISAIDTAGLKSDLSPMIETAVGPR